MERISQRRHIFRVLIIASGKRTKKKSDNTVLGGGSNGAIEIRHSRGTREGNPSLRKGGPTPLSAQLHPRQSLIEWGVGRQGARYQIVEKPL